MIYSVGHSTHTKQGFLEAIKDIDMVIDVRSHPTSRWPQFQQEDMKRWLPLADKSYMWMPNLGGWREDHYDPYHEQMAEVGVNLAAYTNGRFPQHHIAQPRKLESIPTWTNQGLYDYAWYTTTDEFMVGIDELIQAYGGDGIDVALMCAEALWWKCHRSMIADYLAFADVFCGHLPSKPPVRPETPRFTEHKAVIGDRLERYPIPVLLAWNEHLSQQQVA